VHASVIDLTGKINELALHTAKGIFSDIVSIANPVPPCPNLRIQFVLTLSRVLALLGREETRTAAVI
jgi:hypothetical protein